MAKSIRVSPKHGVNPSIAVCAWCGGDKNEIALFGRMNRADDEAPQRVVLDYDPCDKCKEQWSQGVAVVEATTVQPIPYRPPIQKTPDGTEIYPTMRLVVIKREAAEELFPTAKGQDKILLEDAAFQQIFGGVIGENN